ncbi:MAG: hypothetical protein RLY49_533 [Candidatus Parcubacteria bacterium]|jgi:prepilin-type N-terminal cleavage/methylation domain-containing protein
MNNKNIKGFTLIELLVVIAIISLLSSVVLAGLNQSRNKAKMNAIASEMIQLRTEVALVASNGVYNTDVGGYGTGYNNYTQCQSSMEVTIFTDSNASIWRIIDKMRSNVGNTTNIKCYATADAWMLTIDISSLQIPGKRSMCVSGDRVVFPITNNDYIDWMQGCVEI